MGGNLTECRKLQDKEPYNDIIKQYDSLLLFFLFGATASSFTRFLDHTQQRTTVGRTPPDECLARRTETST